MSRLKPCPFCGGKPTINQRHTVVGWEDNGPIEELRYVIECENDNCPCYVESKMYLTIEKTRQAWNTRKPMDKIVAQIERGGIDG